MPDLGLPEVGHGPPHAGVDEREHLLTYVRISPLRDGQVRYPRVKGGVNLAVVQVVLSVENVGGSPGTLCGKRIQGENAVLRLRKLRIKQS